MPTKITTKKAMWTLLATFCSLLVLFIMLFSVAPLISRVFIALFHLKDLTTFLIVDAITSLGISTAAFLVLLLIKRIYSIFVVVFCVIFLFLFWGFESSFFWKGFNPTYPLWYEVNMALNDTVAAIVAIISYKYLLSPENRQDGPPVEDLSRDILKQEIRTLAKIWVACIHGLLAYIFVCHYLQNGVPYLKEYALPLEPIKYSFYALSLLALFLCHHVRKGMLERASIKSDLKIIERAKKVGKPAVIVKYTNGMFVAIAFSEVICFLGVAYFFLSGDFLTLYILFVISAIAMVYYRPKLKDLAYVTIHSEATLASFDKMEPGHWH